MVAQDVRVDPTLLAFPLGLVGHDEDDADVLVLALHRLELVEERRRLAVAVRVDERDSVRQALLDDVAEHAAEDGDPDPAGDERVGAVGLHRQREVALGLLDVDLGADVELGERLLERRVAQPRGEPEHAWLVRRGDDA